MIGRLRGRIVDRHNAQVIVECGGVGYEVTVSGHTLARLPADDLAEVTLRIFTHATENKIGLFGFATAMERQLFDLLITVKNVGPSSAMGILSAGAGPLEIAQLIAAESVAGLTKFKGVGKKTAEMLVVELREKCELLLMTWGASGEVDTVVPAPAPARPPILDEVAQALVQLGWRPAEADKAVGELQPRPGATLEALIREALRAMPR